MNEIKIGNRLIGKKNPCFIIAEAGVNHNGDIKLAKKMVDIAAKADADAVKFQTFTAENVVIGGVEIPDYAKNNIRKNITQLEMIKNYELKFEDFKILKNYCDKKDIIFLSTPHSIDAIDFLENLVPAYKFGSGDITNIPALRYAAKKGKPIILGTGMSTIQEVKAAVKAIEREGNKDVIALHCTTNYPCPFNEVNLRAMTTMQSELDCLVGYSDHTLGLLVSIMAVSNGAVAIEKHFTLDKNLPGPDHKASIEPNELKEMIINIRKAEEVLGSFEKKPTNSEKKIIKLVRKSIISKRDIKKGSVISEKMITFKRPGTGLKPTEVDIIVGKKAKRHIFKDEIFHINMVE